MLIAPCSATTIGKLRVGIYDNAVTLAAASLPKGTPLIIVPAMDEDMWLQPAVQENLQWLKQKGVLVIEPVSGALASGLVGMGRMSEPETIVEQLGSLLGMGEPPPCIVDDAPRLKKAGENLNKKAAELAGKKVLITGGPTYEPIDAVRFIGNRSSGKMAVALALEAREMGAVVTLIMGPTAPFPRLEKAGVIPLQIETAQEMLDAVKAEAPKADIIIMSAAVADFAPEQRAEGKLKKGSEATMTLRLKKNPDLLAEIAKSKKAGQIVVGFALEKGEEAEVYARKKLVEKNLDLIVLNNIAEEGVGFGHDTNKISLFRKNGDSESFPLLTKEECAKIIFELLVKMLS
jgi:phosphopantothenoylcysteine decarboxylase/phosphopantothenate--cysteine ligase